MPVCPCFQNFEFAECLGFTELTAKHKKKVFTFESAFEIETKLVAEGMLLRDITVLVRLRDLKWDIASKV